MALRLTGPQDERLERLRPTRALVDLSRLDANFRAVAAASPVPLMPVVKADAYGHGARQIGLRLERLGAAALAVAYVEEGVVLRQAGVRAPIVVMAGFGPAQSHLLVEHDLTPVLGGLAMVEAAETAAREAGRTLDVHLKVDTGMSRLGLPPEGFEAAAAMAASSPHLRLAGVMTHLASADEDVAATQRQLDVFDGVLESLEARGLRPRWVHAANSAGLSFVRPTHTLARPGLLLYGLRTRPLSPPIDVRPVMRFVTRIELLKEVAEGTSVSYGGRWTAPRRSRIATVPAGYADGVPRTRAMSEQGELKVGDRRVGLAGAVCMDLLMLDVTDHSEAAEHDEVVIFGDDPTAWELADWAGTNAWEILTGVGPRVPRVFHEAGRIVEIDYPYHGIL